MEDNLVKYWRIRCLIAESGVFKLSEPWYREMMRNLDITREEVFNKYQEVKK